MKLIAGDWRFLYGRNFLKNPLQKGGSLFFDFPNKNGVVKYLVCDNIVKLGSTFSTSIEINADDSAIFDYKLEPQNTCDSPAKIRPFILIDMYGEYDRWWSTEGIELKEGSGVLDIPISPQHWVSVFGKLGSYSSKTRKIFNKKIKKPLNVGFTLGGGCFYGHGVRVLNGDANLEIKRLSVK